MASTGSMRHRITFDCLGAVDDGYGNTQSGWVEKFTVWAEVKPKLGGETLLAARLQSQNMVTITVRQSPNTSLVQTDWRARDVREGKEYAIKSIIDPDDGGAWLEMLCQIGVAA
jgi:SPP1 family predicted phage head-tail adaptor